MNDWRDDLTPNEQHDWNRFVANVRAETVKEMAASAFVMSLVPDEEADIKFAVELGLAIMLDKPIIAVAVEGRDVPPGLRRVAAAVIEVDDIDTEAGRLSLQRQLEPLLAKFDVVPRSGPGREAGEAE